MVDVPFPWAPPHTLEGGCCDGPTRLGGGLCWSGNTYPGGGPASNLMASALEPITSITAKGQYFIVVDLCAHKGLVKEQEF